MEVDETVTSSQENTDEDTEDRSDCLSDYSDGNANWYYMPDSILLSIFRYLTPKELTIAGQVCRSWNRISHDEFLWKALFYQTYKIDPDVGIMPG